MTTFLMHITLPGDSFAEQKEKTPSESIQKTEVGSDKGETTAVPDMVLENNEYDAGEVYEGDTVSHAFIIKNRGKGDLVIQSVKPG
jgi:hypothetical protein